MLKDLPREGKIRHIGDTNFTTPQLCALVDAGVAIAVNQQRQSSTARGAAFPGAVIGFLPGPAGILPYVSHKQ